MKSKKFSHFLSFPINKTDISFPCENSHNVTFYRAHCFSTLRGNKLHTLKCDGIDIKCLIIAKLLKY